MASQKRETNDAYNEAFSAATLESKNEIQQSMRIISIATKEEAVRSSFVLTYSCKSFVSFEKRLSEFVAFASPCVVTWMLTSFEGGLSGSASLASPCVFTWTFASFVTVRASGLTMGVTVQLGATFLSNFANLECKS